jgi:hypothetical protein
MALPTGAFVCLTTSYFVGIELTIGGAIYNESAGPTLGSVFHRLASI